MLRHRNEYPVEGILPAFDGATAWLNSQPLMPADLVGRVVLASFGTYTYINWIRSLPYVRAWAHEYQEKGLVVIGIQTPEFEFEGELDNVERAMDELDVGYPVVVDNDHAIWQAFDNHYWPALYFVDAQGQIRHHHFGEGEYEESEMVLQMLLRDAGADVDQGLVDIEPDGVEAAADWASLGSAENYVGYGRASGFDSPGGAVPDARHVYSVPAQLRRNQWALSGDWRIGRSARSSRRGIVTYIQIAYPDRGCREAPKVFWLPSKPPRTGAEIAEPRLQFPAVAGAIWRVRASTSRSKAERVGGSVDGLSARADRRRFGC